jgi:hypothetical protein
MNCISGYAAGSPRFALPDRHRSALLLAVFILAACGIETSESAVPAAKRQYGAHYSLRVDPGNSFVDVALEIQQSQHLLRELRFDGESGQFDEISGDGDIVLTDDAVRWLVPAKGGILHWRVRLEHRRGGGGYDAWLNPKWGIFRAEDVIPRARTRSLQGARSKTTMSFDLPNGWSAVSEYSDKSLPILVNRPDRRFDQPTGWIVMGEIGVRRDTIAGVHVAVAGPQGHAVRRLDMLALLNWTLPELVELLPDPPDRLTIVSAGDPMWRGGLSAPASLFLHADRPLISENATSTLLHEVMHSALSIRASEGYDWIVEGFAEYYSLELLKRGKAISAERHSAAVAEQADWARQSTTLCGRHSTGATTALAVTIFHALNKEILDKTTGVSNLDDLLQQILAARGAVDLANLSKTASDIIGGPSDVLHIDNLPGCSRIPPGKQDT